MLSALAAQQHPTEAAAGSVGVVTHVGGLPVRLFNDVHFARARVILDVDSAHFLAGFEFDALGATGGKSGEVLAFTPDKRFILKSIHGLEHDTLLRLAPALCEHLDRRDKLLCSFLLHFEVRTTQPGHNGVPLPHPANGCYFVMNNCMPVLPKGGPLQFAYTFDLKGCQDDKMMVEAGEKVKQLHIGDGPCCFGCDVEGSVCNTPGRQRYMAGKRVAWSIDFKVSPEDKAYIDRVIASDAHFLQTGLRTMDYSLMVGVVKCTREQVPTLPTTDAPRQPFVLYDGDIATAYYLGIIDYLTEWTLKKRVAHVIKWCFAPKPIATVNPDEYGERFVQHMADKFIVPDDARPITARSPPHQVPAAGRGGGANGGAQQQQLLPVWHPDFFKQFADEDAGRGYGAGPADDQVPRQQQKKKKKKKKRQKKTTGLAEGKVREEGDDKEDAEKKKEEAETAVANTANEDGDGEEDEVVGGGGDGDNDDHAGAPPTRAAAGEGAGRADEEAGEPNASDAGAGAEAGAGADAGGAPKHPEGAGVAKQPAAAGEVARP